MQVDNNLLFKLAKNKSNEPCTLKIGKNSYNADSFELNYSETPLTKPALRGGVYFSDRTAFKAKVRVPDLGIAKILSKTMLGPNQQFEEIQLVTSIWSETQKKTLTIFGHLVNYVQKKSYLELNLMVVGTKLAN